MNNANSIRNTYSEEMVNRISKPKVQLLSLERVRLDLNKLIDNCDNLVINPEIEEKGKYFDDLLNTCYDLGDI
ncbi:hypothetical protein QA584_21190 [Anaerocolumna sp. AGMB13025]|uniref:hypothetical protein n=1 Tax=Anaerocolumna sp. AGMB13025 TaxID=3039116 RepID=UPI00241C539A|nr:hypothetical protein [Anaerocolumna sp. AGMB13025]WFR56108.1 hypothetical protein QA584_21190 [Anaerocolumna sp. AGMB13025]